MSQSTEQTQDVSEWQALVEAGNAAYAVRKYTEAELKFAAALRIAEKWSNDAKNDEANKDAVTEVSERLAKSLNNMAALYHTQGKYKMAEDLYDRCLEIKKRIYGEEHPEVALNLHNLAAVYSAKGRWEQAEAHYKQALALREKSLGESHPDLVPILSNYALMLRRSKRDDDAAAIESRVKAILNAQVEPASNR